MERNNLICLNNRKKSKNSTNFTYHQIGKSKNKSIIDLILVDKSIFNRRSYAEVLQSTLTGHESHFPVITGIRFNRNIPKPHPKFTLRRWNLNALKNESKNTSFISQRDLEISKFINSVPNININSDIEKFTKIFLDTANHSIGKIKKVILNTGSVKKQNKTIKKLKNYLKLLLKMSTTPEAQSQKFDDEIRNVKIQINKIKNIQKKKETKK